MSTETKNSLPLVVPCYNGQALEIDPALVGNGLSALSIKHDLQDLAKCKNITPNKCASNVAGSCHKNDEVKSRNSFWCVHRPELRKLTWAKKLSTRQIAAVLEEHAVGDHYGDLLINTAGNLGAIHRDNNSMTNNGNEVRYIKTESNNYGLDNTSENQSYKKVNSMQPFSDGELEYTPVDGPRNNILSDDDDLDAKYKVHKSYVGMCIDMSHMVFRSPHVYMVTDCGSDPKETKTKELSEDDSKDCDDINEDIELTISQPTSSNQSPTTSSELDSLSSALKLHEATAKSCVPWAGTIPESAFEQDTPPLRQAFQHIDNSQDVTVILAPRYDLPECESAQHSSSGTHLELNPTEIAQIEERIRKNSAKKNRPGSAGSSSGKKHHNTKDNIH